MKYVYIFKAGENHYKVGVSLNVKKRAAAIQTSNANKVYIVGTKLCANAVEVEHRIHTQLKAMGSGGGTEWFHLEPEDVLRLCIMLNTEPEIDVYQNTDLNKQITEQLLRHKRLEKKLDTIINIAQKQKTFVYDEDTQETSAVRNHLLNVNNREAERQEIERQTIELAIEIVKEEGRASTSLLQRRMKIGYGRAARIIDVLEQQGVISEADGSRPRTVLV